MNPPKLSESTEMARSLDRSEDCALLRVAIRAALAGGSLSTVIGVAHAQQAPAPAATPEATLTEVVVTGSRIAIPNQTSISPVTFVSSSEIQQSGVTRVEDLLNQLPQVFADQNSNVSNGSDGTASVNLRGLNAKRTLVLVNGQRLGPGDPTTGAQSDINIIPVEMIDSIEVLTGGASSVYGADAVAGVVNFKLNDHFEGVKIVADGGIYQNHNRDVEGVNEAVQAAGYAEPPGNVWTGAQRSIAVITGLNSADNNGNATFYATYRNVLPVLEAKYAWSACSLVSGYLGTSGGPTGSGGKNGKYACGGSETAYPTNFINGATGAVSTIGPGNSIVAGPSLFNYGALNYFQRNDERYTAGTFMHYDFNEHATVYENLMYMDDRTVAQIAPSGDFGTANSANCANPFLSAAELGLLCGGATAGFSNSAFYFARRNVEGGNRQQSIEHDDFREVLGVKGKIDDVWSYDTSFNYSLVNLNSDALNFLSDKKLANALDVTGTAANPSCVSGPPCVPYNIFQMGGVTQAALNYLYTPGIQSGRITQTDVIANFTGDLEKYSVRIPSATTGLKVNLGAEYRDTTSATLPDEELQTGDLSGAGGATLPVSGGVIAREGFIEANLPVIDDLPAAQAVDVDAGYRYSSYNPGFKTNTFKFGVEWSPIQEIRLRGSFARAVRAPNVIELYGPASVLLDGSYTTDPCAGSKPVYTAAQCARTGVVVSPNPAVNQYRNIVTNTAGQYNGLLGGNPELQPETALTTSFGIGWTPAYVPNLRAQVDYYDIHIENVIQGTGGTVILTECATQGIYCNYIHRDTGNGSLWLSTDGYISDLNVNRAGLREKGVDVDVTYGYDVGAFGKLHTSIVGTYISQYDEIPSQIYPGFAYNCAGLYGPSCSSPTSGAGTPVFRWRHRMTTTWETPWSGLDVTLAWRYYSPVRLESLSPNPNLASTGTIANGAISNTDAYISSYSYFDLTAAVKLADKLTVRVGCNNILDKAPPLVGATNIAAPPTGNGNTFPGVYDSLGRYLFAEVTAQF